MLYVFGIHEDKHFVKVVPKGYNVLDVTDSHLLDCRHIELRPVKILLIIGDLDDQRNIECLL